MVDLWGGVADPDTGRPWTRDTLQLIYSGTKGLVAACVLILVERGALHLDAPVADYWPEFAAHGKDRITVAEVMSHQGRLPGVRARLSRDDVLEPVRMAALLAAQPPESDPRAALIYHALTYGWLTAELIRRVDGRGVDAFFADEIAGPLGLDLWIGLPPEHEHRVSTISYGPDLAAEPDAPAPTDELARIVQANPPMFVRGDMVWNTARVHQAVIPGAGAIGTARSVARFYGCLARGGEIDGVRILSEATLQLGRR